MERFEVPPDGVVSVLDVGLQAGIGVREGGWVPIVLVDTADRPAVAELLRVHEHFEEGDVSISWGRPVGTKDAIYLRIRCARPLETVVALKFPMPHLATSVESILRARCFYLQHGPTGKLSNHLDEPKLLVDIPDTGFGGEWEKIYHSATAKMARASGASFLESRKAADLAITEMREFLNLRLPDS